jgi:hypothetical protein
MCDIKKEYISFVRKTPEENVIWGIHAQVRGGGGLVVWIVDKILVFGPLLRSKYALRGDCPSDFHEI